jgi:DNA-binding CsgD family transcriptional regulator
MTAVDHTTSRFDAPIVGRELDLADVGALLDDHAPLVTVTGRGGVGKTRLAREVLATHQRDHRSAAALVDLTSVRDPDVLPVWEMAMGRIYFPRYLAAVARTEARMGSDAFSRAGSDGAGLGVPGVLAHALERVRVLADRPGAVDLAASIGITQRQLDVLRLAAAGLTNKEIGAELGITPKTVTHHLTAVFQVLGVRTRTEAALWASSHGVTGGP